MMSISADFKKNWSYEMKITGYPEFIKADAQAALHIKQLREDPERCRRMDKMLKAIKNCGYSKAYIANQEACIEAVNKPFNLLAEKILKEEPSSPERAVTLVQLLEAKHCAVRALLFKGE